MSVSEPIPRSPTESVEFITRKRLLQGAGEVFAEKGLPATTVRDICTRAGANIAAVNYHFGGKDQLYAAVLREGIERSGPLLPVDASAPAAERLRCVIRQMLGRMLDPSRPAWHGKLVSREMVDPSPHFGMIEAYIRPTVATYASIIRELTGADADDELVHDLVRSVMGQAVFYKHCRPILEALSPQAAYTPQRLDELADHITRFSLGGIAACRTPTRGKI